MTQQQVAADHLLDCYDRAASADRSTCGPIESMDEARAIQDRIVDARVARGEQRLGYKIGFTNRTIWARYGVHHPIWGPVYDSTVTRLPATNAVVDVSGFAEPRLEPEIVVQLRSVPETADPVAIARCVEWVAHGFEIVQSHFPGWAFSGAESFAAQGLHGALLIGPTVDPAELASSADALPDALAQITVRLGQLDGPQDAFRCVDEGVGTNVLDGPLHAIAHLMRELAASNVSLVAGDIITTGTITDAQPLVAGQQWRSELGNAGSLAGLTITVQE